MSYFLNHCLIKDGFKLPVSLSKCSYTTLQITLIVYSYWVSIDRLVLWGNYLRDDNSKEWNSPVHKVFKLWNILYPKTIVIKCWIHQLWHISISKVRLYTGCTWLVQCQINLWQVLNMTAELFSKDYYICELVYCLTPRPASTSLNISFDVLIVFFWSYSNDAHYCAAPSRVAVTLSSAFQRNLSASSHRINQLWWKPGLSNYNSFSPAWLIIL